LSKRSFLHAEVPVGLAEQLWQPGDFQLGRGADLEAVGDSAIVVGLNIESRVFERSRKREVRDELVPPDDGAGRPDGHLWEIAWNPELGP
jgi:hypothetical protein